MKRLRPYLENGFLELDGVDPQAWLTDVLGRIADHKLNKLDGLMPWRYAQSERNRQLVRRSRWVSPDGYEESRQCGIRIAAFDGPVAVFALCPPGNEEANSQAGFGMMGQRKAGAPETISPAVKDRWFR